MSGILFLLRVELQLWSTCSGIPILIATRDYNHHITQATMYIRVRKRNVHGFAYKVYKARELTQKCQHRCI